MIKKGGGVSGKRKATQIGAFWAMLCTLGMAHGQTFQPFQPLQPQPPVSPDNIANAAKIELGMQLFFDPRLSPKLNYS